MLQRFLPQGPSKSLMSYQIFRNKNSTEEQFQSIHQLYAKVVSEDKILCELSQRNLEAGVFVNGQMHPRLEKGPLYFQKVVRETVREQVEKEKKLGREIWPARQRLQEGEDEVSLEDVQLCEGLACDSGKKSTLAW